MPFDFNRWLLAFASLTAHYSCRREAAIYHSSPLQPLQGISSLGRRSFQKFFMRNVSLCVHALFVCVHVRMQESTCACGGWRTCTTVLPHVLPMLLLRQGLSLPWNSPSRLGWLACNTEIYLSPTPWLDPCTCMGGVLLSGSCLWGF